MRNADIAALASAARIEDNFLYRDHFAAIERIIQQHKDGLILKGEALQMIQEVTTYALSK